MKRGNRNNSYERGGQIELAKAMGNVAKKGDKEINEGREEIKSIRKDITGSENQINNLESGIDREKKSIKDNENVIKDIKKDLGGIYKTVQDAKKQKAKFAKGGTIEERVYAIDMRADMYADEGFFTYNQFKRYADELSDDEFMDEAENQGLVWSSMDGYIMSNEYNEQGAVDSLVERQIPVKMMVAKEYVNPDLLEEGGEVGKTYQIKGADVTFYEDSYEEGEQDQFHSYYLGENDFPYKTKFTNKKDLFETLNDFVSYADMKEEDFYVDEDTIQTSALVKHEKGSDWDEFSAPNEKEKELWKKGEMKLYSAQFVFPYEVYKKEKLEFAKGGKIMKTYDDFDRDYERFTHYVLDRIDLDERRKIREDWNRESRRDMLTKDEKDWQTYLLKRVNEKSYAKGGKIVWVGDMPLDIDGREELTEEEAERLAKEWKEKGYDDVIIEDYAKGGRIKDPKYTYDKRVRYTDKDLKEKFERHGYNVDNDNFEEIAIKEDYIKTANNKWKNKYAKGGMVDGRYLVSLDGRNDLWRGNDYDEAYDEFINERSKYLYKMDVILIDTLNNETLDYYDAQEDREQDDDFAKGGEIEKKGNEEHNTMLIGGIAGILLGIFLGRK